MTNLAGANVHPSFEMEIGFVHGGWPGGEGSGATHSATQVVAGLRDMGHSITVYSRERVPAGERPVSGIEIVELDVDRFPYHSATVLNGELVKRVDELGKYDVVHSYPPTAIPALTRVGAETDAATVVTLNAYGGVCPKNDLLYLDRKNCRDNATAKCIRCIVQTSRGHDEYNMPYRIGSRLGNLRLIRQGTKRIHHIDGFRAPSTHVKKNYVELGFSGEKISVIPHPLNEEFLVDHTSGFSPPYRMLYVGSLETHKGVEKLVPILAGLRNRLDHDVTLTVIGSGGLRSKMEQQVTELDVVDGVEFRGFVPNEQLPAVYAEHDVFVYPGIWEEPLGRVYLEALATGTPIVSTEYGDIGGIIGDGGETVDGSVESFERAITGLVRDDRLESLSEGGKSRAEEYKRDRVAERISAMYEELLGR